MDTGNSVLVQHATLGDIERMIDKAVERRITAFYDSIRAQKDRKIKRKDAAKLLGVSLPTLDSYSRSGLLHAVHVGGRVYFSEVEVLALAGL